MWLPLFLCQVFHRYKWKTPNGMMDAYDYDCPICGYTMCKIRGEYWDRVPYDKALYEKGE